MSTKNRDALHIWWGVFQTRPKKIHFTCYTIPVPSSEVQGTYRSSGLIVSAGIADADGDVFIGHESGDPQ
jgi:hypothetical protein